MLVAGIKTFTTITIGPTIARFREVDPIVRDLMTGHTKIQPISSLVDFDNCSIYFCS